MDPIVVMKTLSNVMKTINCNGHPIEHIIDNVKANLKYCGTIIICIHKIIIQMYMHVYTTIICVSRNT